MGGQCNGQTFAAPLQLAHTGLPFRHDGFLTTVVRGLLLATAAFAALLLIGWAIVRGQPTAAERRASSCTFVEKAQITILGQRFDVPAFKSTTILGTAPDLSETIRISPVLAQPWDMDTLGFCASDLTDLPKMSQFYFERETAADLARETNLPDADSEDKLVIGADGFGWWLSEAPAQDGPADLLIRTREERDGDPLDFLVFLSSTSVLDDGLRYSFMCNPRRATVNTPECDLRLTRASDGMLV